MTTATEFLPECPALVARRPRRTFPPMVVFIGASLAFVAITFAVGAPSPLFVVWQQQWHFPAWILTLTFGIYAITLLATLLVAGALSDHIGRRPLLIAALVTEAVSTALFVVAPDIGWIIVARAIQGIATGAATSTFTAAIVESAPERHKKLGALIGSVAPIGGIALGALATGFAIQFSAHPSPLIFGIITLVLIAGTVIVIGSPETVRPRPGALRSLLPRLAVPGIAQREFGAGIPVLIASWMLAGLYLGLAPSILRGVFRIESGLVSGAAVALMPAAGAIASLAFARIGARRTLIFGTSAVIVGFSLIVAGVTTELLPPMLLGAIIGGAGFGTSFSGALRALGPLADSTQRAELFAAIYLVSYLAYGAPALIAGKLIGVVGLTDTVVGYASVAILAAVIGLVAQSRRAAAAGPAVA